MVHSIYRGVIGYNLKKKLLLSLKINFVPANSVDPDEMPHSCGISSGSSMFAKEHIKDLQFAMG